MHVCVCACECVLLGMPNAKKGEKDRGEDGGGGEDRNRTVEGFEMCAPSHSVSCFSVHLSHL